jgi:hypothetical protein
VILHFCDYTNSRIVGAFGAEFELRDSYGAIWPETQKQAREAAAWASFDRSGRNYSIRRLDWIIFTIT